MAEGVLFNIAEGILANLDSETFKQIRLLFGVKDELRELHDTISTIKVVLLDAEKKKNMNHQVKLWLERLEDVIYDADNLVDELRYTQQQQRRELFGKNKVNKKVRTFFSSSNQLVFRHKIATKIKHIRESLYEIKADKVFLQLDERVEDETRFPSPILGRRETRSYVIDDQVIGRDADKHNIIEFLLDNNVEDKESHVSIVSLVGLGGLGKTTLAQLVFNDEVVQKHFDKKIWACVSDVFDVKLLVQKIIRSLTSTIPDQSLYLEQLVNQLRREIEGKRYLLVLDDVWNEDREKWDTLKAFLNLGAKGSRVLITTRKQSVARIVQSTNTYMLGSLDPENSWALFKRVAFDVEINEPTARHHQLVEIGKNIVDKCEGVPLTIKTIGRLLLSKKYSSQNLEKEWIQFREIELAEVDYRSGILSMLMLSYNNLPSHLKHCFAYCRLFPKDHEIDVQEMIRLWIAQGFIRPSRNGSQLEEIGYEYFMILYSGCFFQEAKIVKLSGTVEYCKMHDLMHDLAIFVAGNSIINILGRNLDEFEMHDNRTRLAENYFEKVRHMLVDFKSGSSGKFPKLLLKYRKMRSFILPKFERSSLSIYDGFLSNFDFLRALSLRIERNMETLPNKLGKLKHLRYLDLSQSYSMKKLPNSITGLYNLQTLILINCDSLVSLPADIQNLINLRHLEIRGCQKLTHMPRGIGELASLQTLDRFIVPKNRSSESAGFRELSKLNNLHGCLAIEIRGLGDSGGAQHYLKDMLHLETLVLGWKVEETMGNTAEYAFECIKPPQHIKAVHVFDYPGEMFPIDWFSLLTNLVQLRLIDCRECKYLPPLHHLSSLEELVLDNLSILEYIVPNWDSEWSRGDDLSTSSKSFFPSLRRLFIRECFNLEGWWGREKGDFSEALTEEHRQQQPYFPNLSELEVLDCPFLTSIPLFPNLKKLELYHTSCKPLQGTIMMKLKSDSTTFAATTSSSSSYPSPLSMLKDLSITRVDDLESVLPEAMHDLVSLQSLSISECSDLVSLPEELSNLLSLQKIEIFSCHNLTSLPEGIGRLSSLTHLIIVGCVKLASLPEGICSLSSLTYLTVVRCSNLTKIPMGIRSLPCLEYVNGQNCREKPINTVDDYLLEENSTA